MLWYAVVCCGMLWYAVVFVVCFGMRWYVQKSVTHLVVQMPTFLAFSYQKTHYSNIFSHNYSWSQVFPVDLSFMI